MLRPALVALALAGALAAPAAAAAQSPATTDPTPVLKVVGQGTALIAPDTAELSATVRKLAPTAEAARADVARRTNALLDALQRLGVPREDVQTGGVSINRRRFRKPPKVRFEAISSVSIVLRDVAKASPVFDALVAAGADDVEGPWFSNASPSAGRAAAEQAALTDARTRADAIAAAVGMRVVGVRSIDLDPGVGDEFASGAASDGASAAPARESAPPTPVAPGREQVYAAVAVVYVLAAA